MSPPAQVQQGPKASPIPPTHRLRRESIVQSRVDPCSAIPTRLLPPTHPELVNVQAHQRRNASPTRTAQPANNARPSFHRLSILGSGVATPDSSGELLAPAVGLLPDKRDSGGPLINHPCLSPGTLPGPRPIRTARQGAQRRTPGCGPPPNLVGHSNPLS